MVRIILLLQRLLNFAAIIVVIIATMSLSLNAQATLPSGVTYHGRILQADGVTPVTGVVTFDIQVKSPDSSNCILYEETQSQNLTGANGVFAITINDGSGTRVDAMPRLSIDDAFSNRVAINHSCSGGPYSPSPGDGRILKVTFQSTTMAMAEPMPDQSLNFAPLAIEAKQISGYAAENILRFENADTSLFTTSPLNNAQYDELVRLVNGTSTQYAAAPNGATGTVIYNSSSGAISSATVGDMWLDTSAGGSVDVLKINTRSGVQQVALSPSGSFITAVTAGTGVNVSTAAGNATVSVANGGIGTTQLANGGVTAAKLDPALNVTTSGFLSARTLTVANTQATPDTVSLFAPAGVFTSYSLVLPPTVGSANQVLKTDGAGNLSWTNAAAGALNSAHIFVGNASNVASDVAMSGDASIDNSGKVTVSGLQGVGISTTAPTDGQVLVFNNGANKWQAQNFSIGSLRTAIGGTQFANASCLPSQALTWSSLTDTFTCANIAGLDASVITTGTIAAARLPAGAADWANNGANISNTNSGNVGIGTTAPDARLSLNANTASQTPNANSIFHMTGADDQSLALTMDAYGSHFYDSPYITLRKAHGTAASPSASQTNDIIGDVQFYGYIGSTWGSAGSIAVNAMENWSGTQSGSNMSFQTVQPGTNSLINSLALVGSQVGVNGILYPRSTMDINGSLAVGTYAGAAAAPSNGLIVSGNVGIGTTSPGYSLSVGDGSAKDGFIMAQGYGNVGTDGQSLAYSGPGTRMFWYPKKAAFRAGSTDTVDINYPTGSQWDDASIGLWSSAFGLDCMASGNASFCAGYESQAGGVASTAFGRSGAYGFASLAAGEYSNATGDDSISLGRQTATYGYAAFAEGQNAFAYGDRSIAMGMGVSVGVEYGGNGYGNNSMGIGLGAPSGAQPVVTGQNALGIFMGDQSGVVLSANNVMAIMGGNVGIGTTAPSAAFEINSGAAGSATGINIGTTTAGANTYEQYKANGSVIGSITSAAGANVAFNTTSDVRLKGGFRPVLSPLKQLNDIEVSNFYYLADPAHQRQDGFKAQQLYTVVPYAVTKPEKDVDENGKLVPWLADYSKVVPLITAGVQELYRDVFGLRSDVAVIKAQHVAQIRDIASLKAEVSKAKLETEKLRQENAAIKSYLCSKDPKSPICK